MPGGLCYLLTCSFGVVGHLFDCRILFQLQFRPKGSWLMALILLVLPPLLSSLAPIGNELACSCGRAEALVFDLCPVRRLCYLFALL
jgi:hypothetical protein